MIRRECGTRLHPAQIQLENLFSVKRNLKSMGFKSNEGNGLNLILSQESWSREDINLIFSIFSDNQKRSELLEYIEEKRSYVDDNLIEQLIDHEKFEKCRKRFSSTFEWFVGELLVKSFGAFSSSYAIEVSKINRNSDGGFSGDFDVLSVLGNMTMLHVECKTGRKLLKKKIINAIERSLALHCSATVIVTKELNEISLKQQLSSCKDFIFGSRDDVKKIFIKDENFFIYKWFDCYFIDSINPLKDQFEIVLRLIQAKLSLNYVRFEINNDYLSSIGYRVE